MPLASREEPQILLCADSGSQFDKPSLMITK